MDLWRLETWAWHLIYRRDLAVFWYFNRWGLHFRVIIIIRSHHIIVKCCINSCAEVNYRFIQVSFRHWSGKSTHTVLFLLILCHVGCFQEVRSRIWNFPDSFEKRISRLIPCKELLMMIPIHIPLWQLTPSSDHVYLLITSIDIIFSHISMVVAVHHHRHIVVRIPVILIILIIYSINHVDLVVQVAKMLVLHPCSWIVLRDIPLRVAHSTSV